MNRDCWIANENGDSVGKVALAGRYQPAPRPRPVYTQFGSDHPVISTSATTPATVVAQRFGWGPGVLSVNLPRATQAIYLGIDALYRRYSGGRHTPVRFFNGDKTWLCNWVDAPRVTPTYRGPERYEIAFQLQIIEEVS